MGLANLFEKCYSFVLVNEFYSRILVHDKEYENPVWFRYDVLYTYFYGQERVIIEFNLGKLLGCEHYRNLYEALNHYPSDNVWDTLIREPAYKNIAPNLKSLPLWFLHHFIASTVQCRTSSSPRWLLMIFGYLRWHQKVLWLTWIGLLWIRWWKS